MYAILRHGGHQYRIGPGDRLLVDRLDAEVGSVIALEPLVFLKPDDDDGPGSTDAAGARFAATVVAHRQGAKLRIFKYKPKKRYRRTMGYRSRLTELRVGELVPAGRKLPAPVEPAAAAPRSRPDPGSTASSGAAPDKRSERTATEGHGDGA